MTDCSQDPLAFWRLTTDSGALLLREVADRLGLFDALDAAIPDPRHPAFIVHDQSASTATPSGGPG